MKCTSCGAPLDLTQSACSRCGADVELGRLTGILGIVCRSCDAYNDPGTKLCTGCGKPLGDPAGEPPPGAETSPAVPPSSPPPAPASPAAVATSRLASISRVASPAASAAGTPAPAAGQPVVRSFQRGGGARAVVPAASGAQPPRGAQPRAATLSGTLVTRCPRCGADASVGTFCSVCGQALGSRGTQVMAPVGAMPAALPSTYAHLTPGRAGLVLERGTASEGALYRLDQAVTAVGRSHGAITFPEDTTLAPHHATFLFKGGSLHVRDEGAPGGVHLRLRGLSIPLRPGDTVIVGDQLLRFAGPLPPAAPLAADGTRRLGAPRPAGAPVVLEELLEGGTIGRVFVRTGPTIRIGRAGCAVNLGDDPYLSEAHAEILVDRDGQVRLKDLGSSNGTFARLPPRSERELRDADVVRMGREVLRVQVAD